MPKFVIETIQVVKYTYYVEVDDVDWAKDSIVLGELDQFSTTYMSEDFLRSEQVEDFPKENRHGPDVSVNACIMKYNEKTDSFESIPAWDYTYPELKR